MYLLDRSLIDNSTLLLNKRYLYKYDIINYYYYKLSFLTEFVNENQLTGRGICIDKSKNKYNQTAVKRKVKTLCFVLYFRTLLFQHFLKSCPLYYPQFKTKWKSAGTAF